jgi:DNA-binding Xre family transcriptional regulator
MAPIIALLAALVLEVPHRPAPRHLIGGRGQKIGRTGLGLLRFEAVNRWVPAQVPRASAIAVGRTQSDGAATVVSSRRHRCHDKRFGENVRKQRMARGWTQEDLAHAAGLAPVQVSRIERGVREVRLTTVARLHRALEVSPGALLKGVV